MSGLIPAPLLGRAASPDTGSEPSGPSRPRDFTDNVALPLKETLASLAQGESVTIVRICAPDHRLESFTSQNSAAGAQTDAARTRAKMRGAFMAIANEYTRTAYMIHSLKMLACLLASALLLPAQSGSIESLAPYTPTPEAIVDRMLQLGELRPGEKMFDLGSGDGRIVILAAKKYKADATGVEFEATLVKQSMKRISNLGLTSMARIVSGDLMKQDYSSADLLTVYLLPIASKKLTPILEKQLKVGTRVVSHNAEFANWTPIKIEEIPDDGQGHRHLLYLYKR